MRQVNNAITHKGPAIVDPYLSGFVGDQALYPKLGAKGQRPVGRGHLLHVKRFSAGSEPALELLAIPAGDADLRFAVRESRLPRATRQAGDDCYNQEDPVEFKEHWRLASVIMVTTVIHLDI
jgi:hypothetical protein